MTQALVRYEEMRIAVERCARIDEAADIRDKAAALQAYARQRDLFVPAPAAPIPTQPSFLDAEVAP